MSEIRIERWSLADYPDDPYCPDEYKVKVLHGEVYGHPRKPDGMKVRSSAIIQSMSSGTRVVTKSGSVYRLGEVDPGYLEWLDHQGYISILPNRSHSARAPGGSRDEIGLLLFGVLVAVDRC